MTTWTLTSADLLMARLHCQLTILVEGGVVLCRRGGRVRENCECSPVPSKMMGDSVDRIIGK